MFVTVAEIKVDGRTFSGFQGPKTINVLELQNGNTLNLGSSQAAAGSYSKVDLVIRSVKDASGSEPGCYVQKTDGTKEKLELSGNGMAEISLKPRDFKVEENGNRTIVMDFDLRKAVRAESNGKASFVSKSKLESAVRAENQAITGNIRGNISNSAAAGSRMVVYVYKKGSFIANSEINGNDTKYPNAVTSARVDGSGNFTLAFLPEGEYEVVCDKPQSSGLGLGLNTLLNLESNLDLRSIKVNAGAQTSLDLK